jgi:hypothetical protein
MATTHSSFAGLRNKGRSSNLPVSDSTFVLGLGILIFEALPRRSAANLDSTVMMILIADWNLQIKFQAVPHNLGSACKVHQIVVQPIKPSSVPRPSCTQKRVAFFFQRAIQQITRVSGCE